MSFLNELLKHYHLTLSDLDARKASGSFLSLEKPFDLPDFKNLINRLNKAIDNQEKTVIYGDYDVDGLTSVAILKLALEEKGLPTSFFIPNRYVEGYGLNINRVREMAKKGYQLIGCVDNGITTFEAIEEAKKLGLDVLVIDHHEPQEKLPICDCYFHQTLSHFLNYNCSAASLTFFVASYLLSRFDAYFASLAGMAVFSDVMPLIGNNLIFAKLMNQFVNKYHYDNLCYILGNGKISYDDISFTLNSSLNAVGRVMKDSLATNNACRLLLEKKNAEAIKKYGSFVLSCNLKKKELLKTVHFEEQYTMESSHSLSVMCSDYEGLAGLYANKSMNEKKIPVAVFAKGKEEGLLTGSIRAPKEYSIDVLLSKYPFLFVAGGGHPQALGCTIKEKDYLLFCTMFASECEKQALEIKKQDEELIPITIEDLNAVNYSIYESFMPFGPLFEEPTFEISVDKNDFSIIGKNKDTYVAYSKDKKGKVILFHGDPALFTDNVEFLEIHGKLKKETFNGIDSFTIVSNTVVSH